VAFMRRQAEPEPVAEPTVEERVRRLENQVEALAEAVEVLAHGIEGSPMTEPQGRRPQDAARRARELLLLAKPAGRAE